MAGQGSKITLAAKDGGSFTGYIAMPAKLPAPAIILAQEIFGVNRVMRDKCDAFAEQGYVAVCPDLFWRLEPGIELDDRKPDELQRAFDLFGKFDVETGIEDLRATLHTMKGHAECTGKVGVVGYCLGGKLAYLMACRSNIDASVGYYGVGLQDMLEEAENISHPLMLHIAEEDKFVPPEAQEKIRASLSKNKHVTLHSYPGCDHAFAREGGDHFDAHNAKIANERTYDFFARTLR
jgi:carboxymethylenebutenolidase